MDIQSENLPPVVEEREPEPDIPSPAGTGLPLADEEKVLLVFSYLGPLALVAFLAARREYVRWHSRQGLVFFAAAFAVMLVTITVETVAESLHPFLGRTTRLFTAAVHLCVFGTAFLCMLKALKGERWRLPVIRDLADRL